MKERKVKYSFAEWCRDNNHQDWLDRWDYELNGVRPEDVAFRCNKKCWFKCGRGLHESEQWLIKSVSNDDANVSCRKCDSIGQFLLDTYGDKAIDDMWSDKNTVDPFLTSKHMKGVKVWLKCRHYNHPDSEFSLISIIRGSTCKACSGGGIVAGYNDIATTHPEYLRYFLDKQDACRVGRWSEKRVRVVCPDCGNIALKRVCDLISYPFNCRRCGDKASYPNKYIYEFLLQLSKIYNFDIYPEHVFEWSKKMSCDDASRRIYDFYIVYNNRHIIIEVHGGQHFDGSFEQYPGGRTLDDELQNDAYKKSLAICNGVLDHDYIVIDARKSDPEWIKKSVLESEIVNIFTFNEQDILWDQCAEFACKNLIKIASELWNNGMKSTSKIGQAVGRTVTTTITYLKKAHNLGWCDYTSQYIKRHSRKAVLCLDNNIAFESAHVCSQHSEDIFGVHMKTNTLQTSISVNNRYRGYLFKYITKEEFDEHYKHYPTLTFFDEYFINNN